MIDFKDAMNLLTGRIACAPVEVTMAICTFHIGAKVCKTGGYDWPGIVVGYAVNSQGGLLINVENRLSPKTVHVFPPSNLMLDTRTDAEILGEVQMRMLP